MLEGYEAGEPKDAEFYNDTDGSIYWQEYYDKSVSQEYGNTYKSKNVINLLPVSNKGVPSWNFITQENAKIVSENMYGNSKTVKSYLIDGVAWDTITNWIEAEGKNVINSVDYGNYYNSHFVINGLYARHGYEGRWFPAYVYHRGIFNKEVDERIEIATGILEKNKSRNIYDFAGNMWEWTTETGAHGESFAKYAVLRGGSFHREGSEFSVSSISGSGSASENSYIDAGFRIVLYIR